MSERLQPAVRNSSLIAAAACALPLFIQMPAWLMAVLAGTMLLGALTQTRLPGALRFFLTLMLAGVVLAAFDFSLGRDTGSAALLAMLAVKPFETHSPRDARSLLGFALFAPFTAFLDDQGPATLALCLVALLLSLMAWTKLLAPGARWPSRLRRAGIALVMAVPLALVGFWLFPRLATPLWGLPKKADTLGLGDRMTPNEWLDLLVDDTPALRAQFRGPTPTRQQLYWRGPVLTYFDGEAWVRNARGWTVAPPRLAPIGGVLRYEVALEPTERRDLIVLDLPTAKPDIDSVSLTGELTAFNRGDPSLLSKLVRYRAESAPLARFIDELDAAERYRTLALPPGHDPRTRALAKLWRQETPDPQALTKRFLDWIRKDFEYTLAAPPVGFNATDDFLFETQQGFCQHFSSAYAVFMRAAGVPTRVVTGYAGGHYNRIGDYWLVYRRDAHAWAEIWVAGRGWLRVDPTAAIAPENILDTIEDLRAEQDQGGAGQAVMQLLDAGDFLRRAWNNLVLSYNADRQKDLLQRFSGGQADSWKLVSAFSIGAGLALALTLWLLLREHRDRSDPLFLAWRTFERRMAKRGFPKRYEEPPLSFGKRLAKRLPRQAKTLLALSQRYVNWRYAGKTLDNEEKRLLIRDLRRFRPRRGHSRAGESS